MIERTKIVETSLVLTTAFLGLYFIFNLHLFLIIALVFGIIGVFIPFLARYIAIGWFKLADGLNFVVSKLILGVVYFLILNPVAFLYKSAVKNRMNFKKPGNTNWILRNVQYQSSDIENIW